MKGRLTRWMWRIVAGVLLMALAAAASAQVVVTVDGDTAHAAVSLTDNNGTTYDADVTIVFDSPENLTPAALNLTATIIDPAEINPRLLVDQYGTSNCLLLICPTIDPAFPVMITVEPIVVPWLFSSGFDSSDGSDGVFSFLNSYQLEIHTHDLAYTDRSPYRVFKAPIGGDFHDITNETAPGSMRARGRGGAFSQFVIANDPRSNSGLLGAGALAVSIQKIGELNIRILAAVLSDGLRLDLIDLLVQVDTLILVDLTGALAALDSLIDLLDLDAGTDIANVWRADHAVVNDAGEMQELAQTLRFSMLLQQGAVAHP